MENQTISINTPICIFTQTKEQNVEADLILPDYYPEISRILDCSLDPYEEAVTLTSDKVSVSAAAKIRLLYTSAEGELKIYETLSRYTKVISGGSFETGDVCCAKQTVVSLNYRAVSPRKVEVRGAVAVQVNVFRMQENVLLSKVNLSGLQARTRSVNMFQIHAFATADFEITDSLNLPEAKDGINAIVRDTAHVRFSEIRAVNNKLMLSGTADIGFTCLTAENGIGNAHTVSLPFTQIREIYGVQENDECYIQADHVTADIDVKSGGDMQAGVTVHIKALIIAGCKTETDYVDDVYGIHGTAKIGKKNGMIAENVTVLPLQTRFEGEASSYDPGVRQTAEPYISDISYNTSVNGGSLEINGAVTVKLFTKNSDGVYELISHRCSFADSVALKEQPLICSAAVIPGPVNAQTSGDGKIRFTGELTVCLMLLNGTQKDVICTADFEETQTPQEQERIVLYYGSAGEDLWEIAKENETPLAALKELNALQEDVLKEDRLLIFRN